MHCAVPTCSNNSRQNSKEIPFFKLPTDAVQRTAWLSVLKMQDCMLQEHSVVCSDHFVKGDLVSTTYKLRTGAVPIVNVQMCRICLGTECKLYPMTSNKVLCTAYETLTGLSLDSYITSSPYMCTECSQRLLDCARFRNRCLRSHSTLLDVVTKHHCITPEFIQSVIRDQSSCLSNNDSEQYELDMELVEREHETEEAADTRQLSGLLVADIKNEQDDVINTDFGNGGTNIGLEVMTNIKGSTAANNDNDNTVNQAVNNDNDNTVNQAVNNENNISDIAIDNSILHDDINVEFKTAIAELDNLNTINKVTNNKVGDGSTLYVDLTNDKATNGELDNSDIVNRQPPVVEIHKDAILESYKRENFDANDDGGDRKVLTNNPNVEGNEFGGENYSFKNGLMLDGVRSTVAPEVAVTPGLYHTTTHSRRVPVADRRLSTDKGLSCDICSYRTTRITKLLSHLKAHAATVSYKCSKCNYRTISKKNHACHIKVHSGEKTYSCSVCSEMFSNKNVLHAHLRIHASEKPYPCNLCTKSFNRRTVLQSHLRVHTGKQRYSCNICPKSFITNYKLKTHMQIHFDGNWYLCNVCDKKYKAKDDLRAHLRIHDDEKPYSCAVCKKAFHKKIGLQRHGQVHTREKPYS